MHMAQLLQAPSLMLLELPAMLVGPLPEVELLALRASQLLRPILPVLLRQPWAGSPARVLLLPELFATPRVALFLRLAWVWVMLVPLAHLQQQVLVACLVPRVRLEFLWAKLAPPACLS